MYYLKQLFPFSYNSRFVENGKTIVMTWKMWFWKCFKVKKYEVRREIM